LGDFADESRFGNFIGEAVDSDEEDQRDEAGVDAYVEYDEEEGPAAGADTQQLMEIDGMRDRLPDG
jgi:U5 small nuclear ribonucleoprotein component